MTTPHDTADCHDCADDEIARLGARVTQLEGALRPFADAGRLFCPVDPSDDSGYIMEPDDAPIGDRRCWDATPVTIRNLRTACHVLAGTSPAPTAMQVALSDRERAGARFYAARDLDHGTNHTPEELTFSIGGRFTDEQRAELWRIYEEKRRELQAGKV